jgi:hypothetical protein
MPSTAAVVMLHKSGNLPLAFAIQCARIQLKAHYTDIVLAIHIEQAGTRHVPSPTLDFAMRILKWRGRVCLYTILCETPNGALGPDLIKRGLVPSPHQRSSATVLMRHPKNTGSAIPPFSPSLFASKFALLTKFRVAASKLIEHRFLAPISYISSSDAEPQCNFHYKAEMLFLYQGD